MDASEFLKRKRALRGRINELAEAQHWVHHIADLNSGNSSTAALERPSTMLSRAERLSKLGPRIDPSIFDGIFGPSYRLTPRRPYQASPAAWLNASTVGDYYAAYDYIVWSMPQQGGADSQGFMTFSFEQAPTMRSVVSISLEGKAWSGKTGHVRVGSETPSASISFPITDAYATHTVDLSFVPVSSQPTVIWMVLEAGIEIMTFRAVSFAAQPLVLESTAL
jgi:hypothetical protein